MLDRKYGPDMSKLIKSSEFTGFAVVDDEETIVDGVPSDFAKRKEQRAISSAHVGRRQISFKNNMSCSMINFHTRSLTFYPKGNRLFKEGDYEGASHVY